MVSWERVVTLEGREVNWLGPIVSEQTKITLLVSLIISFTVSPGTSEKLPINVILQLAVTKYNSLIDKYMSSMEEI